MSINPAPQVILDVIISDYDALAISTNMFVKRHREVVKRIASHFVHSDEDSRAVNPLWLG
jgi:hypothetical protein